MSFSHKCYRQRRFVYKSQFVSIMVCLKCGDYWVYNPSKRQGYRTNHLYALERIDQSERLQRIVYKLRMERANA